MGTSPRGILLAIDGEPHTEAAIDRALALSAGGDRPLTALHVRDPYLKQFYTEIYAQGREEYLAHVDECLRERGEQVAAAFRQRAADHRPEPAIKILDGNPLDVLHAESRRPEYDLLVLGRQRLQGLAAWRSRGLPLKLAAAITHLPVLLVPTDDQG